MNPTITNERLQPPSITGPINSELDRDSLTALQQSARELISRGFFIFPCKPQGKEPLGLYAPHGFKNARNDESVLKAWDDGIAANIGVACGASGITVVDCDTGFQSREQALTWAENLGFDTFTVHTGRREGYGVHFYFKGSRATSKFTMNGASGEVKSNGGYVIGAGSIHESGSVYEIIHDAPFAPLPACFTCISRKPAAQTTDKDLIPEGERRTYLLNRAGMLHNLGLSEDGMYDALIDLLRHRCEEGEKMAVTDDADIRRIAHDATGWEKNEPAAGFVYVGNVSLPSPSSHMTDELYGFYSRALEQSKHNVFYFNGRKFAKKFQHMSDSTAYRRANELEKSGWFELLRPGGKDESGHLLCTLYHIRNLKQWEQWRSQRPTTPAAMPQASQTQTETCITWLQKRLAKGPVYSDELETERKTLGYTRKVYENARTTLSVSWSQKGRRRVSWIGSNGLVIASGRQRKMPTHA